MFSLVIITTTLTPKYIIFAGASYYPLGGWLDLYGFAETEEDAILMCNEAISINSKYTKDYCGDELGVDQDGNQIYSQCDWSHFVCMANNSFKTLLRS